MAKSICITGCSCSIGKALSDLLVAGGYEVTGLRSTLPGVPLLSHESYKEIALPLKEYDQHASFFSQFDAVFHFAWMGTRGQAQNDQWLQAANLKASKVVIDSLAKRQSGFLFLAGTQMEYSPGRGAAPLMEDDPCEPASQYGKYKLETFEYAKRKLKGSGIRLVEGRFFSIYGPGDSRSSLISYLFDVAASRGVAHIGNALNSWNYLFVEDAAKAVDALYRDGRAHGAYNIASLDTRPLRSFVNEAADIIDPGMSIEFDPAPNPDAIELSPSIERIMGEVDWAPSISFEDGIKRMKAAQQ